MLGIRRRSRRWDQEVARLDPVEDAHRIVKILSNHVFPLDLLLAIELAQLRTFTIPTISRLLHRTREFEGDGVKRLDDTKAILSEIVKATPTSTRRADYVARMNAIHGFYKISNDDYLYTLSAFVFDGKLWLDRFGWRPLTEHEQLAFYSFYRVLGEQMHIQDIPPSPEAFWAWRLDHEARAQRFAPENKRVAEGMLNAAAQLVPAPARPLLTPLITALLEDPFREALGLAAPAPALRALAHALMGLRASLLRRFSGWEEAAFWDTAFFNTYQTYPNGYRLSQLGPSKLVARMERK